MAKVYKGILSTTYLKAKYRLPKYKLSASEAAKFRTPEDYTNLLKQVSEENAKAFLDFLLKNIRENRYKFRLRQSTIEKKGGNIPWIDSGELIEHIVQKGSVVTIEKGVHSTGITYEALAYLLEYGRKDLGIPPRDVFRRSFVDFKPIMIEDVLNKT